jgi:hypothetical protein
VGSGCGVGSSGSTSAVGVSDGPADGVSDVALSTTMISSAANAATATSHSTVREPPPPRRGISSDMAAEHARLRAACPTCA